MVWYARLPSLDSRPAAEVSYYEAMRGYVSMPQNRTDTNKERLAEPTTRRDGKSDPQAIDILLLEIHLRKNDTEKSANSPSTGRY